MSIAATQEKNQREHGRFVLDYTGGRMLRNTENFDKSISQELAGKRSDPSASKDDALPQIPSCFLKDKWSQRGKRFTG